MAELNNTPLREFHLEMGAKMVPRSNWNVPLNFSEGAQEEHECCRNGAALFDFCADGRYRIAFPGAAKKMAELLLQGGEALEAGHCRRDYFVSKGTAVCPCHISCMALDDFFVSIPLQSTAKAELFFKEEGIEALSLSEQLASVGICGPESSHVLEAAGVETESLPGSGESCILEIDGLRAIVFCWELFGEEGYVFNFAADCADQVWDLLLDTEIPWPAGIAAQESLRLEKGFISSAELLVPRKKEELPGAFALVAFEGRRAPYAGVKLFDSDNTEKGVVTSSSFCPTLKCAAAMVYFPGGVPETSCKLHADASGVEVTGSVSQKALL